MTIIDKSALSTVVGGASLTYSREPQRAENGAIVGGNALVRLPQSDLNGGIFGGDRYDREGSRVWRDWGRGQGDWVTGGGWVQPKS